MHQCIPEVMLWSTPKVLLQTTLRFRKGIYSLFETMLTMVQVQNCIYFREVWYFNDIKYSISVEYTQCNLQGKGGEDPEFYHTHLHRHVDYKKYRRVLVESNKLWDTGIKIFIILWLLRLKDFSCVRKFPRR